MRDKVSPVRCSHLSCPQCDARVEFGHRSHRGILINSIASLSTRQVTRREQIAFLQKKRWSKAHVKQRELDLRTLSTLQFELARDQELLDDLQTLHKELYGR